MLFVYMSRHCSQPLRCPLDVVLIAEVQLTFAKHFQQGNLFHIQPEGADGFRTVNIMKLISNKSGDLSKSLQSQLFVDFSLILLQGPMNKCIFFRKVRWKVHSWELEVFAPVCLCSFSYIRVQASKAASRMEQTCTQASHCRNCFPRADCSLKDPPNTAMLGFVPSFGYRPKPRTKTGWPSTVLMIVSMAYAAMHRCCWASDAISIAYRMWQHSKDARTVEVAWSCIFPLNALPWLGAHANQEVFGLIGDLYLTVEVGGVTFRSI